MHRIVLLAALFIWSAFMNALINMQFDIFYLEKRMPSPNACEFELEFLLHCYFNLPISLEIRAWHLFNYFLLQLLQLFFAFLSHISLGKN